MTLTRKKTKKNKKEENFLKIWLMMWHKKRFGKVNVMLPYYMWYRFIVHIFLSLCYNFFLFYKDRRALFIKNFVIQLIRLYHIVFPI